MNRQSATVTVMLVAVLLAASCSQEAEYASTCEGNPEALGLTCRLIEQEADGSVRETPYLNGVKHGTEVIRSADGDMIEVPYVNGLVHGTLVGHSADGGVSEIPFVNGVEHGTAFTRLADGVEIFSPYVDGWKWTTESLEGVSGLKNVEERVLCRRTQRLNWKRGEGSPRCGPALTEPPMSQAAKAGGGPPGRRGDQGPQRLRIGSPAVADLHRDRLVKQLEQPEAPRGSGQDGGPAKGGEIEVCEIQVDLRRADFTLLQDSPRR